MRGMFHIYALATAAIGASLRHIDARFRQMDRSHPFMDFFTFRFISEANIQSGTGSPLYTAGKRQRSLSLRSKRRKARRKSKN